MGVEIERRFLVVGDGWRSANQGKRCRQGYLLRSPHRTVRVRVLGDRGSITVKGMGTGISKPEFEYAIPLADAEYMLDCICEKPLIEKTRHRILYRGLAWDVDEFKGANAGLIMAEVELSDEQQPVEPPPWIALEVSADPRYCSASLVENPFTSWGGNG